MHEIALALEIREICDRELVRAGGGRLREVGVDVGAFAGVEVETLRFCLDAVLGERFGGARCEIRLEPARAACLACAETFVVERTPFECPRCGGVARGASGGEGLRVSYLELE
jgi:hydrogenase nickel incorporation protein HypA/HybF